MYLCQKFFSCLSSAKFELDVLTGSDMRTFIYDAKLNMINDLEWDT